MFDASLSRAWRISVSQREIPATEVTMNLFFFNPSRRSRATGIRKKNQKNQKFQNSHLLPTDTPNVVAERLVAAVRSAIVEGHVVRDRRRALRARPIGARRKRTVFAIVVRISVVIDTLKLSSCRKSPSYGFTEISCGVEREVYVVVFYKIVSILSAVL